MKERKPVLCIRKLMNHGQSNIINSNLNTGDKSTFLRSLVLVQFFIRSHIFPRSMSIHYCNITSHRKVMEHFELERISRFPNELGNPINKSNTRVIFLVNQVKSTFNQFIVWLPINFTLIILSLTRKCYPE
uniref:Uncharacterized protein LOC8260571 n=1 Tax=Rhizophora mucronata TaxID=61149 RepID=A0A2P2MKE8_RHIMU